MFSRRRTRAVSDAPYTGVSGIPDNRASSNAHAAASAIAVALKESNGSATKMKLPPTQVRSSSLLRNSNSFRGSLRANSINGVNHSRASSLVYHDSPLQRQQQPQRTHRHSLTPQSLKQLNDQNDFGPIRSNVSSDYGDDDFTADDFKAPPRQFVNGKRSNSIRHKVSFSDASSEISTHRSPMPQYQKHQSQPTTPTRRKTIKKYVPSANGLVAIEVPVEEEQARINSIKNSSRNSSLRGNPRRPLSRATSLTGASQQTRSKVRYSAIPEETSKGLDFETREQVKERLQREREELQQQYLAKLEEERLYQEQIEKERTLAEQAEREKLQKEYEDEVKRQHEIEVEKQKVLAEKAAAEAEEAALIEEQAQARAEAELRNQEQLEASAAAASALEESYSEPSVVDTNENRVDELIYKTKEGEDDDDEARTIESLVTEEKEFKVQPIVSTSSEVKEANGLQVDSIVSGEEKDDDFLRKANTNGSTDPDSSYNGIAQTVTGTSNTELDVVNGYYSTDSLIRDKNDTSSRSVPTSAELSENLGTATDITENESYEENVTDNHMSMAKQLRSAMAAPSVLINDAPEASTADEIPRRSDRRLSTSSAVGNPLTRKKSALKQSARYETSPSRPPNNAAAQAYLSLTTAENTRLNALNTQSSLSLSPPEPSVKKTSPKQPKAALRKSAKPLTPKHQSRIMTDDSATKKKPITIHLPQQVSPGKFVLPKSDTRKKADELYKKANSKPRQQEEALRKNLPPLVKKSSFEKSRDATPQQQRFSMREPAQYNEQAYQQQQQHQQLQQQQQHPPQPQPYRANAGANGFKSRFADSDSDDDFPNAGNFNNRSNNNGTTISHTTRVDEFRTPPRKGGVVGNEVDDEKKKKKFGKLKKLFGRN